MKLIIFGSTGDLVKRKVLPALQSIGNIDVFAFGRQSLTHEEYQEFACKDCVPHFKKKLNYQQIDIKQQDICAECIPYLDKDNENLVYISLPPDLILDTLKALAKLKHKNYKLKILIEKPFGENLKNALELKDFLQKNNLYENTFISDHYLFKENILNLNNKIKQNIKIITLEKLCLENRFYYDNVGALRDMIQSHIFNILFKLNLKDFEIIEYKRAQYQEYAKELGKESDTETYINLKLKSHNKIIELITGKAFNEKLSIIEIDNKKIEIDKKNENPYIKLFQSFFENKKHLFPTIEQSIEAWKIIEKIEKSKPKLDFYEKNSCVNDFI